MPKHAKVDVYSKYDESGQFSGERCPRCNANFANHTDRKICGKCGYAEIKKTE